MSKWVMRTHFSHLFSKSFPMIWRTPQSIEFWPLQFLSENLGVHQDSKSQSGSSLGSVKVHSLTLSYNPESMRCDSWASLLAHNLASPCLGCEPKAKVVIIVNYFMLFYHRILLGILSCWLFKLFYFMLLLVIIL